VSTDPNEQTSGKLSAAEQAEFESQLAAEQGEIDQAAANGELDTTTADDEHADRLAAERAAGTSGSRLDEQAEWLSEQVDNPARPDDSGDAAALREAFPLDREAEAGYPVENGAVKWGDAPNGGDTAPETKAVYDTPWGRREMSHDEVRDLGFQNVVCTPVAAAPETSLDREKADMSHVVLKAGDDPTDA
jgi:hypothetical protein